ncbi:MAG: hypothetical protein PQ964_03665 [Methanobacteriaceae archaeon]
MKKWAYTPENPRLMVTLQHDLWKKIYMNTSIFKVDAHGPVV